MSKLCNFRVYHIVLYFYVHLKCVFSEYLPSKNDSFIFSREHRRPTSLKIKKGSEVLWSFMRGPSIVCDFFFFFIGNKTFVEKKLNMIFTMVNTLNNKTNTKRSRAKGNRK